MKYKLWNMFANLKNGQLAKLPYIMQRKTNLCILCLNVLWDEGYILGYKIDKNLKYIKIFLKYKNGQPVITNIICITKPSNRCYKSITQLWKIELKKELLIVSTSKGVISITDCKKHKIGGEVLAYIY